MSNLKSSITQRFRNGYGGLKCEQSLRITAFAIRAGLEVHAGAHLVLFKLPNMTTVGSLYKHALGPAFLAVLILNDIN